jgi:uncharacterized membrane protein
VQETTTDWTLVSLSPWSGSSLVLAALVVLGAAAAVVWTYRHARRPWLLVATRLAGALLLLGFLTEPALQLRVVRKVKNRLAIVVDRSRSMTLATEAGPSRYDAVLALLEKDRKGLEAMAEDHVIDWLDLDGPLSPAALKNPPTGESTDLLRALETARNAGGGKPLAGVVLLSDGADNAGLEGTPRGQLSAQAVDRLSHLGVPVNTVAVGGEGFRDIGIADVRSDEFAFVHNTFEIEVALESVGFEGVTLPVTLKRDGEVVTSQSVLLGKDGAAKLTVKSKPDKIGEFVYSVSVPVLAGEAIAENNERSFVVSVIRDKIRVLQVAGRPSWDERFLRQLLKENPNVDLISFFILRTPTDSTAAPESELSLIPFPVDKLFTTELRSFDVVIFQDFDFRPYRMSQYLGNIRDAVKQSGLGFVMIGGDQSFSDGGYASTELAEILPVRLDQGGLAEGSITPELTAAGRGHPVTDLARGAGTNDAAWAALPPLPAVNKTGGLAPGATALLVDPRQPSASGPMPVLAVTEAGSGRSLAVATDGLWHWRFGSGKDGGTAERAYYRFWSNALRWLVRDPEHARVRVTPEHRRVELGVPVEVSFAVLDRDYQPVRGASLRVTLSQTGAGAVRLDEVVTGDAGLGRLRYPDLKAGPYRVTAEAFANGTKLGEGQGVFVVESRSIELTHGSPRPDLLAVLAERTGGHALELEPGLWRRARLTDPDVVEVDRRRNLELWDNGWALVVAVALLAADWAARRRRGYL